MAPDDEVAIAIIWMLVRAMLPDLKYTNVVPTQTNSYSKCIWWLGSRCNRA